MLLILWDRVEIVPGTSFFLSFSSHRAGDNSTCIPWYIPGNFYPNGLCILGQSGNRNWYVFFRSSSRSIGRVTTVRTTITGDHIK